MKISVNDQEIFTLTDIQKSVILNDIHEEIFEEDMKRRLIWILFDEKYARCMERLRREWEPKFKERGIAMLPTNDDEFAKLVLSQPDYKNRSQRDFDAKTNR